MASAMSSAGAVKPPQVTEHLELNKVRQNPLAVLLADRERFGDIYEYDIDNWRAVVLNNPAFIRHVLHADYTVYSKEGTPDPTMLKPMLGEGLMTTEGAVWERLRRASQPEFGRSRVDGYLPLMIQPVDAMLERWEEKAGLAVDIENEMSRLTLTVVASCLFGADLGDTEAEFGSAVGEMNSYMGHFDPNDFERLVRFQGAVFVLNKIVNTIIQQRRACPSAAPDLLKKLMQDEEQNSRSDKSLRDQIFTFLMADHETTAKTLTWTLWLLDQNPECWERLCTEVDGVLGGRQIREDDIDRLGYTWMVLQEAMRLCPPVWLVSRLCRQGDTIGGYQIEGGTLAMISPYVMHRDPRYWNDPLRFDPDRFSPANSSQRIPYTYLPFSGGPRTCIGRTFATMEMIVGLSKIAQRFIPRLVDGHPVEPEALVTLRPKFGMPMLLQRRTTFEEHAHNGPRPGPKSAEVPLSSGGEGSRPVLTFEEHAHNGPRPRHSETPVPLSYGAVARGLCASCR